MEQKTVTVSQKCTVPYLEGIVLLTAAEATASLALSATNPSEVFADGPPTPTPTLPFKRFDEVTAPPDVAQLTRELNLPTAGLTYFFDPMQKTIRSIIEHTTARNVNATNPLYQEGHCPKLTLQMLEQLAGIIAGNSNPKNVTIFTQEILGKGGTPTGEYTYIIYSKGPGQGGKEETILTFLKACSLNSVALKSLFEAAGMTEIELSPEFPTLKT